MSANFGLTATAARTCEEIPLLNLVEAWVDILGKDKSGGIHLDRRFMPLRLLGADA